MNRSGEFKPFTVSELHYQSILIKERLEKHYSTIFEECFNLLRYNATEGNKEYCYFVPSTLDNEDKYDLIDCLAFVIKKLRENKIWVRYIEPNILYISWYHPDEETEKQKNKELLIKENLKTKLIYAKTGSLKPFFVKKKKKKALAIEQANINQKQLSSDKKPMLRITYND